MIRSACALSLLVFASTGMALAQAAPAVRQPLASLSAGACFGVANPDYGPSKDFAAVGAYADLAVNRWLGIEGEASFARFHNYAGIAEDAYLGGPRVAFQHRRFTPYGKALVGLGKFYFPYGYAHATYLTTAYGGGLDYRLGRRFTVRAMDFEYQRWSGFPIKNFAPYGLKAGIAFRLF